MIDLHNNIETRRVVAPIAGATTHEGQIIDRQNFASVEFAIAHGVHTTSGVTVTPALLEGAATGTLTTVADADILGTIAGATMTATGSGSIDNKVAKLGYIGSKRYVRLNVTTSAASQVVAAVAILGNPRKPPKTAQIT